MDINWDDYVFVDAETTGLDVNEHEVLEVTYALGLSAPVTLYPEFHPDIFESADPRALEVNKFFDRFPGDDNGETFVVNRAARDLEGVVYNKWLGRHEVWLDVPLEASYGEWETFVHRIKGKTWVGANPEFDVAFIKNYLSDFKLAHNHRLFNLGGYAAGKFGAAKPIGFSDLTAMINDSLLYGEIPEGDHTAERDVLTTRQVFAALMGQESTLRNLMKAENPRRK